MNFKIQILIFCIIHSELNYIIRLFQWRTFIPAFIMYKKILTKFNYKQELLQPLQELFVLTQKLI